MITEIKIILAFMCGGLIGTGWMFYSLKTTPTKSYPIKVQVEWYGYSGYKIIECDSVIGDIIYKDGNKIVTEEIMHITLK